MHVSDGPRMPERKKTRMNLQRVSSVLLMAFFTTVILAKSPSRNRQENKPAPGTTTPEIEKGKAIYIKRCAVCHFAGSDAKKVGPGLKGLVKRGKFADGKAVTDDSLRAWIDNGGKNMPGFKAILGAEQVQELIVYLKTL